MALEREISRSPAVRRELEKFERVQIWISDPKLGELATEQRRLMLDRFDTLSIPLHVIVKPPDAKELARYEYNPVGTVEGYVAFLRKGLAKFQER